MGEIKLGIEIKDINNGLGAVIIGVDTVNANELINSIISLLTQDDEIIKKYKFFISDYSEVTDMDIEINEMKKLARISVETSKINPNIVSAIIADQDLTYGLSRMATAYKYQSKWVKEIFRDKQDALSFIVDRVDEIISVEDLVW